MINTVGQKLPSPYVMPGLSSCGIQALKRSIALYFGTTVEQMESPCRQGKESRARFYFCYIQKKLIGDISFKEIGKAIGGRDHSTIINAVNTFQNDLDTDIVLREKFELFLYKTNINWLTKFQQLSTQR